MFNLTSLSYQPIIDYESVATEILKDKLLHKLPEINSEELCDIIARYILIGQIQFNLVQEVMKTHLPITDEIMHMLLNSQLDNYKLPIVKENEFIILKNVGHIMSEYIKNLRTNLNQNGGRAYG